ncbi:U8-like protein [Lissonota sp. PSUC_FEM 10030012]|nr:U8-like protein [Lissonota sp. PSUC_FEM 10030012]
MTRSRYPKGSGTLNKRENVLQSVEDDLQALITKTVDERQHWAKAVLESVETYAVRLPVKIKDSKSGVEYMYA